MMTPDWRLIEPIELAFESVGIEHLGEASVLHWESGHPRIIDFGITGATADDEHS